MTDIGQRGHVKALVRWLEWEIAFSVLILLSPRFGKMFHCRFTVTSRNSDSILIIFSLIYNYAYGLLCNYLCLFVYISGMNLISQHYLPSILPAPDIATADRQFLMITDISF